MGATFNRDLLHSVGIELGKEAKLKNAGVLLGPTINIHRHPYGEVARPKFVDYD